MSGRNIPKQLRDVTVSIGGAVVTGFVYCGAATVATGTIGISSVTHVVILAIAAVFVMVPTVLAIRAERRMDEQIDFEEERA